jgi:hypothetical protein
MSVDENRGQFESPLQRGWRSLYRRRHDLALSIERIGLASLRFPGGRRRARDCTRSNGRFRIGSPHRPDISQRSVFFSEPKNLATNKPTRQQSSNSASARVSVIADIIIPIAS